MAKGDQYQAHTEKYHDKKSKKSYKPVWIIISFIILITILLLPTPAGLPVNFSFVMSQLDKDEIFYSYYIILSKHQISLSTQKT